MSSLHDIVVDIDIYMGVAFHRFNIENDVNRLHCIMQYFGDDLQCSLPYTTTNTTVPNIVMEKQFVTPYMCIIDILERPPRQGVWLLLVFHVLQLRPIKFTQEKICCISKFSTKHPQKPD
jgi:hypothetical protein